MCSPLTRDIKQYKNKIVTLLKSYHRHISPTSSLVDLELVAGSDVLITPTCGEYQST